MTEHESELFFDIGQTIGQGGQADVYLVRLRATGGVYAGKFLREAWDPLAREQFRREAIRQHRVGGDHVVRIVAWDLDAERPFLILEYMPHGSLADEIERRGRFSKADALTVTREIAVTLAELHARGVVHRDLKPGNILRAPDGRLKLSDLGYAATMTFAEHVRAPGFVGTPAYAAPEQLLGFASPKSDVFALGVILCELVLGVPRPRSQMTGVAIGDLDMLVAQLCAKEAGLRPTALEAITLLDAALRRLHAARRSPSVELGPTAPRSSSRSTSGGDGPWGWLVGAAALFGAVALISGGGSTWDPWVGRYRGPDGRFKNG